MPPEISVPADATVPAVVEQALARCDDAYGTALRMPYDTHLEQAMRADALAEARAARVAWWRVLLQWMFTTHCSLSWIFTSAVLHACRADEESARFWRDVAADEHAAHTARLLDPCPAFRSAS